VPIALVEYRPRAPLSAAEALALFKQTAPRYLDIPELVRKYYLPA